MTEAPPLVSVNVITFDQRAFIGKAIDSVLAQETDFPVEIRIGDDFSTDGTREVLEDYARRFPGKVHLHLQPERPGGVPGRVNNATTLRACRGRYIALLDGDDYWTDPGKLARQVAFLEAHPGHAGHAFDSVVHDEDRGLILDRSFYRRTFLRAPPGTRDFGPVDMLKFSFFQASTLCFRREAVEALPEWFDRIPSGDRALFMFVSERGPIRFEGEAMAAYRIHAGNYARVRTALERGEALLENSRFLHGAYPRHMSATARAARLLAEASVERAKGRYGRAAMSGLRSVLRQPGYAGLLLGRRLTRRLNRPGSPAR